MPIRMTGTEAHLEGDWTSSGAELNINSLAHSLQQLESGNEEILRIDCGQVQEADVTGLELLQVWLECARIRGVKPILVNISERLQQIMHDLNFRHCLTADCLDTNLAA